MSIFSAAPNATKFTAINPATGKPINREFIESTAAEIDLAVKQAEIAFDAYREKTPAEKAAFLDKIGEEILALGDILITTCTEETGLPAARLAGERGRTINQLKLFASLLREGSWVQAIIETAQPDRQPLPKPDIRSMHIPLGPVGIFGASNFPLAFSVAGGDTASALAAGCPVVVKAHPAHPATSQMVGEAILRAAEATNMPAGTFAFIHGQSHAVGMALVQHPLIKAIGFTGSFKGGKALFEAAIQRPEPIPVYAEMGSTNPVFVLPGAIQKRGESLAPGLANSVTLGVGQFCTNPGLVVAIDGVETDAVMAKTGELLGNTQAGVMLTPAIKSAFDNGVSRLTQMEGMQVLAKGLDSESFCGGTTHLFKTSGEAFLQNPELGEEVFGPSTVFIATRNKEEMLTVAHHLQGHLTATIQATPEDLQEYTDLIKILERKVGRLLINGFPTGVEVCHSMVHGGPYPATTDSRTTSVGTQAIYRFTRPICYQDFPTDILPPALQDHNPLNIWRKTNGELRK